MNEVMEKEVFKVIRDINISKSSGLDNISSFVVKEAFTILISEVTFMYNLSIRTSEFQRPGNKRWSSQSRRRVI